MTALLLVHLCRNVSLLPYEQSALVPAAAIRQIGLSSRSDRALEYKSTNLPSIRSLQLNFISNFTHIFLQERGINTTATRTHPTLPVPPHSQLINMRVFVTGATGYIGTAVVDTLLARGHSVLGLSRSEASAAALTRKGAQAHHGSLDDLPTLTQGAASCDGVIHLAFTGGFADFERACRADKSAIETIGHALAESGSGKALVIASGTLILASESTEPATEDQALDMSSLLAIRAQSEDAALECAKRGVRTSIVRLPPTNHGAGDVRGFIAQMVAKARQEGMSAFIGEGGNVWPATARLDAAKAFVLALERGAAGDVFRE